MIDSREEKAKKLLIILCVESLLLTLIEHYQTASVVIVLLLGLMAANGILIFMWVKDSTRIKLLNALIAMFGITFLAFLISNIITIILAILWIW